jgi:hypothetical protein
MNRPTATLNPKMLLDHRLIVQPAANDSVRIEYILREVSPTGLNYRFENRGGNQFWCRSNEYLILEDLGHVA